MAIARGNQSRGEDPLQKGNPESRVEKVALSEAEGLLPIVPNHERVGMRLGPGKDEQRSVTILNRILEWTDEGINYEADARHAEQVVRDLGVCQAKEVVTPGVRQEEPKDEEREGEDVRR